VVNALQTRSGSGQSKPFSASEKPAQFNQTAWILR